MGGWSESLRAGYEAEEKFMRLLYENDIEFDDETQQRLWYDVKILGCDKDYRIEVKNIDTKANTSNISLINRVNHGRLGSFRREGVPLYVFALMENLGCITGDKYMKF